MKCAFITDVHANLPALEAVLADTVHGRTNESSPTFSSATAVAHWAFDDPPAVQGSEVERTAAFRRVRDEIRLRLFLLAQRPR